MERLIDFVLHYEFELKQSSGSLTTHQKSQMALLRRMLLDLGVEAWAVYGGESPPVASQAPTSTREENSSHSRASTGSDGRQE